MSPSAFTRGHGQAIFHTLHYLRYLKEIGANVLNGYDAYVYEFSKASQISLLQRLGIRYPQARVINHPCQWTGRIAERPSFRLAEGLDDGLDDGQMKL